MENDLFGYTKPKAQIISFEIIRRRGFKGTIIPPTRSDICVWREPLFHSQKNKVPFLCRNLIARKHPRMFHCK